MINQECIQTEPRPPADKTLVEFRKNLATAFQEPSVRRLLIPRVAAASGEEGLNQGDSAKVLAKTETTLELDLIVLRQELQIREQINSDRVAEYAERMQAGDAFPPLRVVLIADEYVLVDGFHRFKAMQSIGQTRAKVEVSVGGFIEAVELAAGSNKDHGLYRSNADKRRAVLLALRYRSDMSNVYIAKLCGVAHGFVAKVRNEGGHQPSSEEGCEVRMGRDGKRRRVSGKPRGQVGEATVVPEVPHQVEAIEPTPTGRHGFSEDAAWERIERWLKGEFEKWPEELRSELTRRVRLLMDEQEGFAVSGACVGVDQEA